VNVFEVVNPCALNGEDLVCLRLLNRHGSV
jgi:hypothetical protein